MSSIDTSHQQGPWNTPPRFSSQSLVLRNPTRFDAETAVLVETAASAASRPLPADPQAEARRLRVPAGGEVALAP